MNTNSKKFEGKVAVVTGASKGIGAAIAKQLGAEGAPVIVNYSSSKGDADKVVTEITSAGGKAVAVQANIAKKADFERLFAEAKKAFGRLDILVNNAGIYKFEPLENVSEEHFHRQFNLNVLGLIAAQARANAITALAGQRIGSPRHSRERDQSWHGRDGGHSFLGYYGKRDAQTGRSADTTRPHRAASRHCCSRSVPGLIRFLVDYWRDLCDLRRQPLTSESGVLTDAIGQTLPLNESATKGRASRWIIRKHEIVHDA
jgi:hypothetical protein